MAFSLMALALALAVPAAPLPIPTPVHPVDVTPAPQPVPAVRARPLGDQSQWVTFDDYPPVAISEHREGRVMMMLRVNRLGFVEGCTVMTSSGSPDLDQAACTAMSVRGFFTPAKDAAGQPMASDVQRRVTWQLPVAAPAPAVPAAPAPTPAAPPPR